MSAPAYSYRVVTPVFVDAVNCCASLYVNVAPGAAVRFPTPSYAYPAEVICPTALYVNVCELVLSPVCFAVSRFPAASYVYAHVVFVAPPA
ncbi:hypothetical protein [Curtobacterium sp. C2H10]|uniref:hypothetical protein n=1 Tax=Curtobacterium sp. C2H10 TaxID=2736664 RepID=UPI0021BE0CBE|nr:hypothetical protein [Curtobacterium sp. C2H10]MCT9620079.1 hypothetical protein [Curtobacterium sp. C2H10]